MRQFQITKNDEGIRFDKFLRKQLPAATGGFIYKMLRKKNITLNGKKASGNERLVTGDEVMIFFSEETFLAMAKSNDRSDVFSQFRNVPSDIDIVFEDENYLLINKPVGLLSQKAGADDISLNEMIIAYLIKSGSLTKERMQTYKPSVMNRLDRNTSGLVIAAKTYPGARKVSFALKEHRLCKKYHALVSGNVTLTGELNGYIKKDNSNRSRILDQPSDGAKEIKMRIVAVRHYGNYSLLTIELLTGRSHQIRAWLSFLGFPIIGDPKYGNRTINERFSGNMNKIHQLLHARELTFLDGNTYIADYPSDFAAILSSLESTN